LVGADVLDDAKTIGDYARDLRRRAPHALPAFRAFAHTYEFAIYGVGECDALHYRQLRERADAVPRIAPTERRTAA
jgi:hypothetical protein